MLSIEAEIENIPYNPQLCSPLAIVSMEDFKSGRAFTKGRFLLEYRTGRTFAVTRWTSPKPSRTYPTARVYDTLNFEPRITIIPIAKDEGKEGEPDLLQWDTISLMSLLKVYVIPAYYKSAEKSPKYPNKITRQIFDYDYLLQRLDALAQFNQSDAVHWNMNEIQTHGVEVAKRAGYYYQKISARTGVQMHGTRGLDRRINDLLRDVADFRSYSRNRAKSAQTRESQTTHQAERLTGKKAIITIKNFIGGYYFWTVDEAELFRDGIFLIEKKNSEKSILPSIGAVKDALLRMVLFTNLTHVTVDRKAYKPYPVIGLTSDIVQGFCHSNMPDAEIENFFNVNNFNPHARLLIRKIFGEGQVNRFVVFVGSSSINIGQILSGK